MEIELLAPAGNFESLIAAVESGADAVYLGGTKFNARAAADNFDEEMLIKAVKYAHIRNVKIYITVNILISDGEMEDVLEYIQFLYNNDIDGIIVQDIGLLYLIKKFFPDMPVHCSTQMTIHNKDGVILLRGLGADRFVLAREMSIKEVGNLIKDTGAEIEVFVHGALCVCYSGQCLMSSLIGGRSGNRGKCAQPCRKLYTLFELDNNRPLDSNEKSYLLSTKDLSTIERLDEIVRWGVKSLKIEGRLKRPEYVAIVVKHYKDALVKIEAYGKADINESINIELENAFNRGFTHGFLFNEKKHELVNRVKPESRETLAAKALYDKARKEYFYENKRKIYLKAELFIRLGEKLLIRMWDREGRSIESQSEYVVQKAEKMSITKDKAIAQLEKTGDTPYVFEDINICIDHDVYVPISVLNEIRRNGLKAMDEILSHRNDRKSTNYCKIDFSFDFLTKKRDDNKDIRFGASLWDYENIKPAIEAGIDHIYYGAQDRIDEAVELCRKNNTEIFYFLPNIIKDGEKEKYGRIIKENSFDGIVISNISQLSFADIKPGMKVVGNYSLNAFNKRSMDIILSLGTHIICPSVELTLKQLKPIAQYFGSSMELVAYGQLPLMTMEYCPLSSAAGCKSCNRQMNCGLKDERGAVFPIFCSGHKTQLLNSHVLFMAEDMNKIIETGIKRIRLDFYREKAQDVKTIIDLYRNFESPDKQKYDGLIQNIKNAGHTKGHYFRGVD